MKEVRTSSHLEGGWVDYVEGELTRDEKQEFELLLRFSKTDQEIVKNIVELKSLIARTGEHLAVPDDLFFENLHDKIMKKCETKLVGGTKINPNKLSKLKRIFY